MHKIYTRLLLCTTAALALLLPADPLAWPDESADKAPRQVQEQLQQLASDVQAGMQFTQAFGQALQRLEPLSRSHRTAILQQLEWLLLSLRPVARAELITALPFEWGELIKLYGPDGVDIPPLQARDWLERNAGHPARDFVQQKARAAVRDSDTQRIALALPQDDPYTDVSKAIVSGVVNSYYAIANARPEIVFMDTADKTADELLSEAHSADVDVLIGPLLPNRVEAVVRAYAQGRYPFSMLVLNQAPLPLPRGVFTYFLSPESEASQIAARMQHLGVQAPLVMLADDDWARRQLTRLQQIWGDLVVSEPLQDNPELTAIIARALGTSQSSDRYRRIERIGRLQLEFEPRRRTDLDALVLLAPAPIARRIHPALAFNFAKDITLLAGRRTLESQNNDADLYQLNAITLPLLVSTSPDSQWNQSPQASVFTAMGMDALHLARNLTPDYRLYGASGFLRIAADGQVIYQPTWGRYTQQGIIASETFHYYPLFRTYRQDDGAVGETPP